MNKVSLYWPTPDDLMDNSSDIYVDKNQVVEVELQERPTGKVLYVNIDGVTVMRIGGIKNVVKTKL